MSAPTLTPLLEYFAGDVLDPAEAARVLAHVDDAERRRLLAALLTVRPARPVPAEVLDALETQLRSERDSRGQIEATTLPTLADERFVADGFPADRIALWRGDLTRLRADAIVNAANAQMLGCFQPGHACIDNAIHAAAGPRLRAECAAHMREQGHLEPTGAATLTGGYALPASHVIHTVGPIVRDGLNAEHRDALASSYRSTLDTAEAAGIRTVGLCSVSTGVFGFPKEPAARICLDTIATWFAAHPHSELRVIISLFADVDERTYRSALEEVIRR
ncbi:protein-ADP-ribose hydrolase [Microbacterium sp. AGC85]